MPRNYHCDCQASTEPLGHQLDIKLCTEKYNGKIHNLDTSASDHHQMLNYSKLGNEDQHSQILSLLLREEEVCRTVNQTVALPVGLLQTPCTRSTDNGRQRTSSFREAETLVNTVKNRVIDTSWGTLFCLCTSSHTPWFTCLNSRTCYSIHSEASPFSTSQTTSTRSPMRNRKGKVQLHIQSSARSTTP